MRSTDYVLDAKPLNRSGRDEDLLGRLATAFDKAWNDRDTKKLADLFISDTDFVCPDGKTLIGTAEKIISGESIVTMIYNKKPH